MPFTVTVSTVEFPSVILPVIPKLCYWHPCPLGHSLPPRCAFLNEGYVVASEFEGEPEFVSDMGRDSFIAVLREAFFNKGFSERW